MTRRMPLDRLRRLTAAEAAWRARTFARQAGDRLAHAVWPSRWRRGSLARALGAGDGMGEVRALVGEGQSLDAHRLLCAHVRSRPVRFLLHPSMREPLRARILRAFPSAAEDARALADRIVAGEYDLLGYEGLRFDPVEGDRPRGTLTGPVPALPSVPAVDWHLDPVSGRRAPKAFWADVPYLDPASGDHKVIWELNRHQHWLALGRAWWLTGDHRYRARFIAEVESWMAANPPLAGINWASALELAFRAISWTWAIELFADEHEQHDTPWLVDLLVGLDAQLRHLERNLSRYFSPNTHLLGEALALYVCGRAWPELRDAARWAGLGGEILLGETRRQVLADGFHAERSPHYHRYALDFYLLALATARTTADEDREAAFAGVCGPMAAALRHVTDAAGRIPLIGDDDGGELFPITGHAPDDVRPTLAWAAALLGREDLAIGAAPESVLWRTAGVEASKGAPTAAVPQAKRFRDASVVLGASGYHVSRRNGTLLVFDAGAHGFMNGGHAHADALSVIVSPGPHRFLVDPGTGTYTMDPALRDRLRSSQWHNTLTLDDRSQSTPAGPFHWARTAATRVERAVVGAAFDVFHASTDAYQPMRHERVVLATGERTWIVADRVTGPGRGRAAVHWHVDPAWEATTDHQGGWLLAHPSGIEARLAMTHATVDAFRGDAATGLGWVAPVYGRLTPATTLRGTSERQAPFWIITTLDIGDPHVGEAATTALEVPTGGAYGTACGVMTRRARHIELTAFRATAVRDTMTFQLGPRTALAVTTDAAAVHARVSLAGRLERVCLVDATVFHFDGAAPVTVTCADPLDDLEVCFDTAGPPRLSTSGPTGGVTVSPDGRDDGSGGTVTPAHQPALQQ